ncbi:IMV envelope protein p35 [Moosepox virus GoldyGopher14]|nr:IMV envelope protein p35 [Moosepox virus GoldyGopher14]
MAKPTPFEVSVFIIPIVGRSGFDVIPDMQLESSSAKDIYEINKEDKTPGFSLEKDKDLSFSYKYYNWKRVEHSGGIENFKEYFSGFCNFMCTSEIKESIVKHFSLWESLAQASILDKENKFIFVIEDDNTLYDIITLHRCIYSMQEKNIDFLQMREILHNNNVRTLFNQEPNKETMYSYTGSYDFSLSAYIIRLSTATELIHEILKMNGISTSLGFEMYRLENEKGLNRQVLNDASTYLEHNIKYISDKRVKDMRNGIWNRIGKWISTRFPDFAYILSHPLFSFFGLFDVTIIGVLIILFIIIMAIFDVNSKLLWFIAGILFTYII